MPTTKYDYYLSFGFNCELGFALQQSNIFEPTVFSWADIRGTDALIYGIEHPQNLLTGNVIRYSANMFFCEESKIGFHGRLKFSECILSNGAPDEVRIMESFDELQSRIRYLDKKTSEMLNNNKCLVIVKWFCDTFEERYTPQESANTIKNALSIRHPKSEFDLLYIFEHSSKYENWDSIDNFGRAIDTFSPRSNAAAINKDSWASLLNEFI